MKLLADLNKRALIFALIMLVSLLLTEFLAPKNLLVPTQPDLEKITPSSFGDWREVKSNLIQVGLTTNTDEKTKDMDNPYDQVLMRSYENSKGQRVMLALAWGQKQQQEVKIHRPELCYAAQGFVVNSIKRHNFNLSSLGNKPVVGKQMLAKHGQQIEAVNYWIRIGDYYSESAFFTRLNILKAGLAGKVHDGILVRVSSYADPINPVPAFDLNDSFIKELVSNTSRSDQPILIR